jgi:hypothetical protein
MTSEGRTYGRLLSDADEGISSATRATISAELA